MLSILCTSSVLVHPMHNETFHWAILFMRTVLTRITVA